MDKIAYSLLVLGGIAGVTVEAVIPGAQTVLSLFSGIVFGFGMVRLMLSRSE